jgi:hypothetical protein
MYIKASEVTSFTFSSIYTRYQLLEIFKYIDSNKISSFSYFLMYSYNLRVLDIDTSNGTNFSGFLLSCYSFNQPLNIDTSKGTSFSYFLQNCHSLTYPITIDLSSATSAIGTYFCNNCYSLSGLHLLNMGSVHTELNISNSNLDVDDLVLLFNDLYDRSSMFMFRGTITITGCYGTSRLTTGQRSIATSKNWTISG